uniref:Uncharacterized protein n=1 Tax=Romanomermis culicivorax TaxID=13658 RepID=A0A915KJC3_ROMCU
MVISYPSQQPAIVIVLPLALRVASMLIFVKLDSRSLTLRCGNRMDTVLR